MAFDEAKRIDHVNLLLKIFGIKKEIKKSADISLTNLSKTRTCVPELSHPLPTMLGIFGLLKNWLGYSFYATSCAGDLRLEVQRIVLRRLGRFGRRP